MRAITNTNPLQRKSSFSPPTFTQTKSRTKYKIISKDQQIQKKRICAVNTKQTLNPQGLETMEYPDTECKELCQMQENLD